MPSDLEKLKELLFGHEKKALDAITRRLDTTESRTADVADVLPEAIVQSSEQGPRLKRSLKKPLEETLTDAIVRDPQRFAVALYPVIGPAIRRAIAEAMKSLVASMNRAIDTSLSPVARYKARRAGVSLGEWVLRESLVFRVDEVYLIDPRTGLLIEHAHHPDSDAKDEDAVSAMLTAIQDFVSDSFSADEGKLQSATVGQFTVWVSQGPYAMLAAVIRGTPPADLRNVLDATVERVHLSHAAQLRDFSGGHLDNLEPELANCLRYRLKPEAEAGKSVGAPLILMGVALVALLGYLIYEEFRRDRQLRQWRDALASAPGIVVTEAWRDTRGWRRKEHYLATGLRDPLSVDPMTAASEVGIPEGFAHATFEPYASLDAPMVIARARSVLAPPDSVTLTLDSGVLSALGDAPADWQRSFRQLGPSFAGVTAIDASGLTSGDAEVFARVMRATKPPESVQVRVADGVAFFSGLAPQSWIDALTSRLATVDGLRGTDRQALGSEQAQRYEQLRQSLSDRRVYFVAGTRVTAPADVSAIGRDMNELITLSNQLGRPTRFFLTGLTDGRGSEAANRQLRIARAEWVRARLLELGVPRDALLIRSGGAATPSQSGDPQRRSVVVTLAEDQRDLRGP